MLKTGSSKNVSKENKKKGFRKDKETGLNKAKLFEKENFVKPV